MAKITVSLASAIIDSNAEHEVTSLMVPVPWCWNGAEWGTSPLYAPVAINTVRFRRRCSRVRSETMSLGSVPQSAGTNSRWQLEYS